MITKKQMETMDITHRHAGNGYAVCQVLDKDYVRLTPVDGKEFKTRAFLAATSLLTVSQIRECDLKTGQLISVKDRQLSPEKSADLAELRGKIESGQLKVSDTRIVPA